MKKFIAFFLCISCLAVLCIAFYYPIGGSNEKQKRFEGKIELWHIVSFKTAASSGYSFLKNTVRELERSYPYVYIDVRGMDVNEAKERLKEGEKPDVISYPMGFEFKKDLIRLEKKSFSSKFASSDFAYPYMADTYCAVINKDMQFKAGLNSAGEGRITEDEFYSLASLNNGGISFTSLPFCNFENVKNGLCFAKADIITQRKANYSKEIRVQYSKKDFLSGKTAIYICPYAEYVKMTEKEKNVPQMTACDFCSYTDLVQYISAIESGDELKNEVLKKICESVTTKKSTERVCKMGMLPTSENIPESFSRLSSLMLLQG